MLRQMKKKQLMKIKFIALMISLGASIFIQPNSAQAQKKKTTMANASQITSVTTDISAAAQKSCKKVPTVDDSDGSEFNLMCGGTGGYNFYFWLDSETLKPVGWGYVRNAKIPNFYPGLVMGESYLNEEEDENDNGDAPNERSTSDATEYGTSPDYRRKVGDKIEWFTRGGKVLAYAYHAYFFKDAENTLKVLDPKKADAEFVFVRGVEKYESLEQDINVRKASGNVDEQARAAVREYFAKKK